MNWRVAAAFLCVAAMLAAFPYIWRLAIAPGEAKAEEPWRGVVSVWLVETWRPGAGSHATWLRKQAHAFEKANKGVWLDVRVIEPAAAELAITSPDAQLPDVLIWGSGLLTSPEGVLMPLSGDEHARAPFRESATWQGSVWGLPLSAGGYAAVLNRETLTKAGVGENAGFSYIASVAYTYKSGKTSKKGYALQAPSDRYNSALAALVYAWGAPETEALPPDFGHPADGWAEFAIDRRTAAYMGTTYEARRIGVLNGRGQAFEWGLLAPERTLCDLVLYGSVVSPLRTDAGDNAEGRITAAVAFLAQLVSTDAQTALREAGAMPVIDMDALYTSADGVYFQIESSLANAVTPNAFAWAQGTRALKDELARVSTAGQAVDAAAAMLERCGLTDAGHIDE